MPYQRCGGRRRGTPNRRTVLIEKLLMLAEQRPILSLSEVLAALSQDPDLPGDTRFKIIDERLQKLTAKRRKVPEELRALLLIVQDTRAPMSARRKAVGRLAVIILPKKTANHRWRYRTGKYGFKFNLLIAKDYRDLQLKLRKLEPEIACGRLPRTDPEFTSVTSKVTDLREQLVLRTAPPESYGIHQIAEDRKQLEYLELKRAGGTVLTEDEDNREAECRARYDGYVYGPEQTARDRRQVLEQQYCQSLYEGWRDWEKRDQQKLNIKAQSDLRALRVLYP